MTQLLLAGAVLLLLANLIGLLLSMRAPEIDGYIDFAGAATKTADQTLLDLAALPRGITSLDVATKATRIVHDGVAHVRPEHVKENGFDHYSMRIPFTENWILFLLSIVKPDTYRDYEFCSYSRAINRGTGRCGQQALVLVSFLEERGFDTGFVALGGHAIATAKTDEMGWVLLDPDYGGVIPFDLSVAERDPASVLSHYWSEAARKNRIDKLYSSEHNSVKLGGVAARYARACPIEYLAYLLKWFIPAVLFGLGFGLRIILGNKKPDRIGVSE